MGSALEPYITKLQQRISLRGPEMAEAMECIVSGGTDDDGIEAFLLFLKRKGETAEEIVSAAIVMRHHAVAFRRAPLPLLDTCGTGGDDRRTLNASTLAALTACADGIAVAKHGNRSVSSLCGSADLLEMLGLKLDLEVPQLEAMLEATGFVFLFAPQFHPATRHAMAARRRIHGKTIFNLLGPLCNPAHAERRLLGVYSEQLVGTMAKALEELDVERALVVHGSDGLDEISPSAPTHVAELERGLIRRYDIRPQELGIPHVLPADLVCDSKEMCRDKALSVLKGEEGPAFTMVSLNAGAAFYLSGRAATLHQGVELAAGLLRSGAVYKKLQEIVEFSMRQGTGDDTP